MTLSELLPTIQSLPTDDKIRLIQVLAADLFREEGDMLDTKDKAIPIWSPYNSFEGAATLLRTLDENEAAFQ